MERRRYPRKEMNFIIDYRSRNIFQYKMGNNISLGGMFIQTDKVDPPGTKVNLVIYFPQEKEGFTILGRVVWVRQTDQKGPDGKIYPAGMGIEFLESSQRLKEKVQGYLFKE